MALTCSSLSLNVPSSLTLWRGSSISAISGVDVAGRPVAFHQALARRRRVGRGADEGDDFVDIGHRDGKADQHMGAVARLVEQEPGPPRHHALAEGDEGGEHLPDAHQLRLAAVERDEIAAERGLQRREAIELVQNDVGHRLALQFDDDAHAVAVALVADVGDAFDALVAHQFGDLLDHRRLVHLIGDFGDDERLALLADFLDGHLAAHEDRAPAGLVGRADAGAAEDDAAGREIRAGHDLAKLVDVDAGIVHHRDGGVDDLAEIVGRDVGRHADGDAAAAVDQEIGEARRQDRRLALRVVVVVAEVDGVLVEVLEQGAGDLLHAAFGVAHGRRHIAVDRAEIALPVDQAVAHAKSPAPCAPATCRRPRRRAGGIYR